MRRTVLLLALAALAACSRDKLFPGQPRFLHELSVPGPEADSSRTVTPGPHVWATAVRFPDGHDWEVDTCAVEGDVWLDLYCDGQLLSSVPAGASLQPDMHRFAGGHLYADCSTDTETILSCDGTELFRFEGRESIRGFRIREDGVHTLGQDRDGDGLTYRIDGREVFRSPAGSLFGEREALTEIGESLFFCYSLKRDSGQEFRLMRGAELVEVSEPEGIVYDFCPVDGKAYWVQFHRGSLALAGDGKNTALALKSGEKVRSCRITPGADGPYVSVQTDRNGTRYSFVRTAAGSMCYLTDGLTVGPILTDGKDTGWIISGADGSIRFMRAQGDAVPIPRGGFLYGDRCAQYRDGHLFLALSGHFGEPGWLVRDSEATEIPFNGYFTSITSE